MESRFYQNKQAFTPLHPESPVFQNGDDGKIEIKLSGKPRPKGRGVTGFTLLEIIIAVAILSTGIIAVLQALSYSARLTGLSCDMANAAFLCEDKMQELEFNLTRNLTSSLNIRGEKEKFKWESRAQLNPALKLYQVNFTVNWQRANRQEKIDLNTFFLKDEAE